MKVRKMTKNLTAARCPRPVLVHVAPVPVHVAPVRDSRDGLSMDPKNVRRRELAAAKRAAAA